MPTAKGWSAADIRRLTEPAAPGPWLTLAVVVPVAPPGDGGAVVSDSDRGPATADGQPWKGV